MDVPGTTPGSKCRPLQQDAPPPCLASGQLYVFSRQRPDFLGFHHRNHGPTVFRQTLSLVVHRPFPRDPAFGHHGLSFLSLGTNVLLLHKLINGYGVIAIDKGFQCQIIRLFHLFF